MKYLPLLLLIWLLSCSDDESYRDLSGEWEFSKGDISGTVIITAAGHQFNTLPGSAFTIAGVEYTNIKMSMIDMDHSDLWLITLADEGMHHYILLGSGNKNGANSRINYMEAEWGANCESGECITEGTEEKIVLKRK